MTVVSLRDSVSEPDIVARLKIVLATPGLPTMPPFRADSILPYSECSSAADFPILDSSSDIGRSQ